MRDEIIDFHIERSRHEQVLGRDDVLHKLRSWLAGDGGARRSQWIALLGSPGVGKSAIVSRLLDTLPGPTPPHHFVRRGIEGWDRPETIVRNLCAQIEALFPALRDPEARAETRLPSLLARVSAAGRSMVLVVDGIDEIDDVRNRAQQPFLPSSLPRGIAVVCASRPNHATWLDRVDGVRKINLDEPPWSSSNQDACRAYWRHHAPLFTPELSEAVVERAVRLSAGNLLHAVKLREWLDDQPTENRALPSFPPGLDDFLQQLWVDVMAGDDRTRDRAVQGLGLICASREALPLPLVSELLGWSMGDEDAFLRVSRPFLLEERSAHDGLTRLYRVYHESFRAFVVSRVGHKIDDHHARIVETLAAWPPSSDAPHDFRRAYALKHAVAHRVAARKLKEAFSLCRDTSYLTTKCIEHGVSAVEQDFEILLRESGGEASLDLTDIYVAIGTDAATLRESPAELPSLLYNRLRCTGWSHDRIGKALNFAEGERLVLRHPIYLGTTLLRVLSGHERGIVAASLVAGGHRLLSASSDRTLRLWSLRSGECEAILRGHSDELTACAVSPDGSRALSTSVDGTARVWDLEKATCTATLDNEGRWATACTFIDDGRRAIVGSDDGAIRVFDATTGERLAWWSAHADWTDTGHASGYVTACTVTTDGLHAITGSRDASVGVWEIATGRCIRRLLVDAVSGGPTSAGARPQSEAETAANTNTTERWVTAVALTPDGRWIVAASLDGSSGGCVTIWDVDTGRRRSRVTTDWRIDACAVTPDSRQIVFGSPDGDVRFWDLDRSRTTAQLKAHRRSLRPSDVDSVTSCLVTSNGKYLMSASADGSIKLWALSSRDGAAARHHVRPVSACAVRRDGHVAVSASEDRTLKLWDTRSGDCLRTTAISDEVPTACAIADDGSLVAAGTLGGTVHVWRTSDGGPRQRLQGHGDRVTACALIGGGRVLSASADHTLRLWDAVGGTCLVVLDEHTDAVTGCAVTGDGARALSVSRDGTLKVWALGSGRCEGTWPTPGSPIAIALGRDAATTAIAFEDGSFHLFDLRSGSTRTLHGPGKRLFGCAVSADGKRALAASEDAAVRVYDTGSGEHVATIRGTEWFRCVAAAKDVMVAGDEDGNTWIVSDASAASPPPPPLPPPSAVPWTRADVGIVVALQEEFDVLHQQIRDDVGFDDDVEGKSWFLFRRPRPSERPYDCVTALVGSAGEERARHLTERLVRRWNPAVVVLVGISGSLHDDARLGDVIVADEIMRYVESAKAVDDKRPGRRARPGRSSAEASVRFTLHLGGNSYRGPQDLLDAVHHLPFRHPAAFEQWQQQCAAEVEALCEREPKAKRLVDREVLRDRSRLSVAHVASGPIVSGSKAFATWLRQHNRNVKAIDMESGGVAAALANPSPTRVLVVRGISDRADGAKSDLDRIGGGELRRLAMKNALSLVWTLMETGVLSAHPSPAGARSTSRT